MIYYVFYLFICFASVTAMDEAMAQKRKSLDLPEELRNKLFTVESYLDQAEGIIYRANGADHGQAYTTALQLYIHSAALFLDLNECGYGRGIERACKTWQEDVSLMMEKLKSIPSAQKPDQSQAKDDYERVWNRVRQYLPQDQQKNERSSQGGGSRHATPLRRLNSLLHRSCSRSCDADNQ